jgi:adenylate cyclase class 2
MNVSSSHGKPDQTREIEVKLAAVSAEDALERLNAGGFVVTQRRSFESNEVYDTPDRALRKDRRLLRLREFAGAATFTYKGTPETGRYKSREELETEVADAAMLRLLLDRLGYELFFRYEKYRTIYSRPGEPEGVAVLDETPIGVWMELEGTPEWIDANAARIGYGHDQYVTESYGALWIEHCKRLGVEAQHMVFEAGGE